MTNCQKIITLGYLDTFINGLIQSSDNASILSVNYGGRPASYCPTYSELTGGTYIQVSSHNDSPNLDNDGILINGAYLENQNVRQVDLVAIYTRFKELTIAASPSSNLSPCPTAVTLSYVLKYTRYTKTHDSATNCDSSITTSSEVTDSIAAVDWSQSPTIGTISYPTFNINKNTSSSERYTTISASVTFRGQVRPSNYVTLSQNGLGGAWENVSISSTTPTYSNFVLTVYEFGCNGGTATGTVDKSIDYYDIQQWRDSCGTLDPTNTRTVFNRTETTSLPWSDTVTQADCSDTRYVSGGQYHRTYVPTASGVSADRAIEQTCTCSSCTCSLFTLNSNILTFDSSATTVQYMGYTSNSCITNISVNVNNTHFLVVLDSSNSRISVKPNGENTSPNDETGTVTVTYMADTTPCSTTFAVRQLARTCTCNSLSLAGNSITWNGSNTDEKYMRYTSESCIKNITSSVSNAHFMTSTQADTKQIFVEPLSANTTLTPITGVVTVTYDSTSTIGCTKTFNVIHNPRECNCETFVLEETEASWDGSSTIVQSIRYRSDECISNIIATVTNSHFAATANTSAHTIDIWPITENDTPNEIDGKVRITYNSGNIEDCSKIINICHKKKIETCSCYTISNISTPIVVDGKASGTAIVTWDYVLHEWTGDYVVDTTGTTSTTFNYTLNTSCDEVIEQSSYTWIGHKQCDSYNKCTNNDAIINYTIIKTSGCCCDTALNMAKNTLSWDSTDTSLQSVGYTANSCVNGAISVSVTSGASHFTASANTTNNTIDVKPTSVNSTSSKIGGIVTISYNIEGSSNPCSKTIELNHESPTGTPYTCYTVNNSSITTSTTIVGEGGTTKIIWTATENQYDGNGRLVSSTTVNGQSSDIPYDKNITCSPVTRSGSVTWTNHTDCNTSSNCVINYSFTQPSWCCCDTALSLDTNSINWNSTEVSTKSVNYTKSNCITSVTASVTSGSQYFTASANTANNKVDVKTNGENSTSNDYTGQVTVTYYISGETSPCTKTISLRQRAATGIPYTCYTVNNSSITTSTTVVASSGSTKIVWTATENQYDANGRLVSSTTVNGQSSDISYETNKTCNSITRSGSVTWSGHMDCSTLSDCIINYSFMQPSGCCCDSITASTTALTFTSSESGSGSAKEVTVSKGSCITDVSAICTSGSDIFNVSYNSSTNKVIVYPKSENTSQNDRSGIAKISYKAYGETQCTDIQITLTQNGSDVPPCDCSNIVITEII